jgi:phosphoglucomutase
MDAIRKAGVRLALDPRWGAARGWLDAILKEHGIEHTVIHDHRDVTFGGGGPDISASNLRDLSGTVTAGGFTLGLATDGDADRFGIVDSDGACIGANLILALLADYLAESRGFRQGLGRTYATTGLIDAVARHYDVPVRQTPVGFKYLGELINEGSIFMAGEESAGMSMVGHLPEKDGILAGLLTAEMVAVRGRGIARLREDLFEKVGALHSLREDCRVTREQIEKLRVLMGSPPASLGSRRVARVTVLDGLRLDFEDGAWILMRPSGTEPVVRYYVEAPDERALAALLREGKAIL